MNSALLLLGASAASELTAQVITTIITFLLVMWVLTKFGFKPAVEVAEARQKEISQSFENIDKKVADAERRLNEYEEKLKHIDEEARERQNKAIDEGRKMAEEIVSKARKDAEDITTKAKEAMDMEIEKARVQLRQDTVEMTLAATGKLLSAELDDDKHRQLVESFVKELESKPA